MTYDSGVDHRLRKPALVISLLLAAAAATLKWTTDDPIWSAPAALAVLVCILAFLPWRGVRTLGAGLFTRADGRCVRCGYPNIGLESKRCPECGNWLPAGNRHIAELCGAHAAAGPAECVICGTACEGPGPCATCGSRRRRAASEASPGR